LTLFKAQKLVKFALKQKETTKNGLLDPNMSWNHGHEMSKEVANSFADYINRDILFLKVLQKQLPPLSKCNHPKELHDKCDGKCYCMGCNEDLE